MLVECYFSNWTFHLSCRMNVAMSVCVIYSGSWLCTSGFLKCMRSCPAWNGMRMWGFCQAIRIYAMCICLCIASVGILCYHFVYKLQPPDACTMAMILSLAVCYCSRLIDQKQFEEQVVTQFVQPFQLPGGVATFRRTVFRFAFFVINPLEP